MKSTTKMMGEMGKKLTGFTFNDEGKELQGSIEEYRDKSLRIFQGG